MTVLMPAQQAAQETRSRSRRRGSCSRHSLVLALALTASLQPLGARASRSSGQLEPLPEGNAQAHLALQAPKSFASEIGGLVGEVSQKLESGLNYSYSLAVQEDNRYQQLRNKLQQGLQSFAIGSRSLEALLPKEQLRKLSEIKEVLAGAVAPQNEHSQQVLLDVASSDSGAASAESSAEGASEDPANQSSKDEDPSEADDPRPADEQPGAEGEATAEELPAIQVAEGETDSGEPVAAVEVAAGEKDMGLRPTHRSGTAAAAVDDSADSLSSAEEAEAMEVSSDLAEAGSGDGSPQDVGAP